MQLFVGLGNPGKEYAGHRHNIGFMAMDAMADRYGASTWSKKFSGELADMTVGGEKLLLLKPQTYMNRSGRSVQAAMQFYKITPAQVTVFHDELDLPFSKLRIKRGGGHGGHNGLRDIDAQIGKEYRRVRLGIGHPGHKDAVTGYVLHDFAKAEQETVQRWLELLADEAEALLKLDDTGVMTRLAKV